MRTLFLTTMAATLSLSLIGCEQQSASPVVAAEPAAPSFDTPEAKVSYGLGISYAAQITGSGFAIDMGGFNAGVADGVAGNDPQVTEEELRTAQQAVMEVLQETQRAKAEQAGGKNAAAATAYLEENAKKEGVQVTKSGLQYRVLTEAEGAKPAATDMVSVHYRGTLINGDEFDSSHKRGQPAEFRLNQVIPGWTEGLQLMSVGSKYELVIPPALGYGAGGNSAIEPNSLLIFEVELLAIVDEKAAK